MPRFAAVFKFKKNFLET